jgi:hypothetical protein
MSLFVCLSGSWCDFVVQKGGAEAPHGDLDLFREDFGDFDESA